jgi:hypothetical protein
MSELECLGHFKAVGKKLTWTKRELYWGDGINVKTTQSEDGTKGFTLQITYINIMSENKLCLTRRKTN